MNNLISTPNPVLISLVGLSETGKSQFVYNWLRNGTFQPKHDKILLFLTPLSDTLWCYAKRDRKSRVCSRCKLGIYKIRQKNNGTKNLLLFGDSCQEIFSSKVFVDIAIAGRHRGLSTIYIEHNLFLQSKLARDVELQNTHVVLFKSPRDVLQVSTLSTQMRLGSELFDWTRDAISVPYGRSLIDLSPRTEDRLRYCTNTGFILSKLFNPDWLKQSNNLDNEHTNTLYSPSAPILLPQMQKSFPSVFPKKVYRVSLRMHNKYAQRKPAKHKKTSRGKVSQRSSTIVSKTYNLEQKRRLSGVRKKLTAH